MASPYPALLPRVLSIAGTDPSGGAGTAADMKSIIAAGGYAMTAVTAIVAQNTHGVREIHSPPASFLAAQLRAVSDDVEVDAVKTGMLGTLPAIEAVSAWLDANPPSILVVDPVMVSTSGHRLLAPEAEAAMVEFCRRATVVTPNIPELARLCDRPPATTRRQAVEQATVWARQSGVAVVVKTGHLAGPSVTNTWVGPDGPLFSTAGRRVETTNTHGTGCSLAAALATRLARGDSPAAALAWTTTWLHEAVAHGHRLAVGSGNGPVDHSRRSRRLQAAGAADPWLDAESAVPALESAEELLRMVPAEDPAAATPGAAVPPAGPWTRALWRAGRASTAAIADCDFVRALHAGNLPSEAFEFYLAQDARYLGRYSRALAALDTDSAPAGARTFWAGSARRALTVEAEMHRTLLGGRVAATMSPVTRSYTDFLLAASFAEPYAVGAAAVLPCFWLYAQTGSGAPEVATDHPYAEWLATYRDPAFRGSVREAVGHVEDAMAAATPSVRAEAARAYLLACRHELEFFEQALRLEQVGPAPELTTAIAVAS